MRDAQGHWWSGWPGAHCMGCGIGDPREECIADDPNCHCVEGGGDPNFVQIKPCKAIIPKCTKHYDPP